ncbi:MAG: hypothetical protein E6045_06200, partial [Finegoldia magna]|nr:hypothetical protein [Finegoldia magna]
MKRNKIKRAIKKFIGSPFFFFLCKKYEKRGIMILDIKKVSHLRRYVIMACTTLLVGKEAS